MVFPENATTQVVIDGKETIRIIPRPRMYPEFSSESIFYVFLQTKMYGSAMKFRGLAKKMLDKFPLVDEILSLNNSKLKIITKSLKTANTIIKDEELRSLYRVNVPFDLCEVKGVVGIPVDYSEKEIFDYTNIKHKAEFGFIEHLEKLSVLEVRRNMRTVTDKESGAKSRVDVNSVVITFPGTILPSHVELDGLVYPVKSFIEPVLQCYKCFKFKHTTKSCRKKNMLCRKCSKAHENITESCNSTEFCVNCKGQHSSLNKNCPHYIKIKKANDEKAKKGQPKKSFSSPFTLDFFPPLGARKHSQKKKASPPLEGGPSSLNDPPPNKRQASIQFEQTAVMPSPKQQAANEANQTQESIETQHSPDGIITPSPLAVDTFNSQTTFSTDNLAKNTITNYFSYNAHISNLQSDLSQSQIISTPNIDEDGN